MASAQDPPFSGGSGSKAAKEDQSSISSRDSSHASCSTHSTATVGSGVLSREPGVTIFGDSRAPACSAIASRKRRPACEVGTMTKVDGNASRSARSSAAARPRNGLSQPTKTRSIVIDANPNEITRGLNQIHYKTQGNDGVPRQKNGPEPKCGPGPGKLMNWRDVYSAASATATAGAFE